MQKFYMVLNIATNYTAFKHPSYAAAKEEAARLARTHNDTKFIVLMAVAEIYVSDLTIDELEADEIPF